MREVDVIVLGAGISGSVAAALLAHQGKRVVMISRDSGTANHLPESWIYHSSASTRLLNIEDKLTDTLRKQTQCIFSSANGQQTIRVSVNETQDTISPGDIVWVNRNQFDCILLDSALTAGVEFIPNSHILNCEITSRVNLSYENQGQMHHLSASHIVDATGKSALLSQLLQLPSIEKKLDSRIACFTHYELPDEKLTEMRIICINGGYIFCIPLIDRRISVGCVLAEHHLQNTKSMDELFHSTLALSSCTMQLIEHAKQMLPIIPAKNYQKISQEPSGQYYHLVGDAAAFLDPFFCPGIDFAFFSAEQAVESIKKNSSINYKTALFHWLEHMSESVYQGIEQSKWKDIMRIFADPHLPLAVPLMFTQGFTQITGNNIPFKEGIQLARESYEMASY